MRAMKKSYWNTPRKSTAFGKAIGRGLRIRTPIKGSAFVVKRRAPCRPGPYHTAKRPASRVAWGHPTRRDVSSIRPVCSPLFPATTSARAWNPSQLYGAARKKPFTRYPAPSGTGTPCALGGMYPAFEYPSPPPIRKSRSLAPSSSRNRSIPLDERVTYLTLLPRLEGHFARLESAGSRHEAGKEPEPLELVDHDVILGLVPEEDLRPRGRG